MAGHAINFEVAAIAGWSADEIHCGASSIATDLAAIPDSLRLPAAWLFIAREDVMMDYSIVQSGLDMNRVVDALANRGAGSLGRTQEIAAQRLAVHLPVIVVDETSRAQFVLDAISMPEEIPRRKQSHQHNKSARLRALHW